MNEAVLATLAPSPARRWAGIGVYWALALILLSVAVQGSGGLAVQAGFAAMVVAAIWAGERMRKATADRIELTRAGLRTGSGIVLAEIADIARIERGVFALKPSQGFLVRLNRPGAPGWAPGLWWRRGTFLGIGGVVSRAEARAMADILTALMADRDAD